MFSHKESYKNFTVSSYLRDLDTLIKPFPPTNGNPKDNDQNEVQDPPPIASGSLVQKSGG